MGLDEVLLCLLTVSSFICLGRYCYFADDVVHVVYLLIASSSGSTVNSTTNASGRPSTPATGLWSRSDSGNNNSNSSSSSQSPSMSGSNGNAKITRRKLVAEVKALRVEVSLVLV